MKPSETHSGEARIAVVGPGALGCLFAHRLSMAGFDVSLIDKDEARAGRLRARGVGPVGGALAPIPVLAPSDEACFDLALVVVKSFATRSAAEWLAARLDERAVAVTLQNGLGNVETLAEVLGPARVGGGSTAVGSVLAGEGRYRSGGIGATRMAALGAEAGPGVATLAEALSAAGLPATVENDLERVLWEKLAVSAAINPCASLLAATNGGLAASPFWSRLSAAAGLEVAAVARACGVEQDAGATWAKVMEVLLATAANKNSMLADLEAGRRTEIDAITGEVVRRGGNKGVDVEVNHALWTLICALEQEEGSGDE